MKDRIIGANAAVIGGGLAGLTAATILAKSGMSVALFEKSQSLGGRASTITKNGYHFNLGPHALYSAGLASGILRGIGVQYTGATPKTSGAYAIYKNERHTLPAGGFSLMTTGLLGLSAKLELAQFLKNIAEIDASAIDNWTVNQWLEREFRNPEARDLIRAYFRVGSYANAPDLQSAGDAIAQFKMALAEGVTYVDGGWRTLIDSLRDIALRAGVKIVNSARVRSIECESGRIRSLRLSDGTAYFADQAIIAAGPADARDLLEGKNEALNSWARDLIPVRAAILDVGLSYLPNPKAIFALGIDKPHYLSVHSATAKLAENGGAVIHVAKYRPTYDVSDPTETEIELENTLELIQPGWREALVAKRFLPNLTVTHALTTAKMGGRSGRPGPAVPGVEGLFVAGDWAGPEGLLADASVASAKLAAETVIERVLSLEASISGLQLKRHRDVTVRGA